MLGCLCACLIKSDLLLDEGVSLTLWDSKEHAEDYEKGVVFNELLEKVRPFLADSSEWKIHLSQYLELEYQPVPEEPVVESYPTVAQTDAKIPDHDNRSLMYLRMLSIETKPGKIDEFRRLYVEEIIPVLCAVRGCRYAFLTENSEEKDETLSVTIWDSKQDENEYEKSGTFDR